MLGCDNDGISCSSSSEREDVDVLLVAIVLVSFFRITIPVKGLCDVCGWLAGNR